MGFSCEKTHHRTSPSEQSWIEPIGCEQLPTTANTNTNNNIIITGSNASRKQQHQTTFQQPGSHRQQKQNKQRHSPATATEVVPAVTGSGFHYPFNLFHPFHPSSSSSQSTLQYSTIILDKLSQFITKHVAARSGSTRHDPPVELPSSWSVKSRPASRASDGSDLKPPASSSAPASTDVVHSHDDTGCRSLPEAVAVADADADAEAATKYHSSTLLTCDDDGCDPARVIVPGAANATPSSSCDPLAATSYLGPWASSSASSTTTSTITSSSSSSSSHQLPPSAARDSTRRQTTLNLTCTTTTTGTGTATSTGTTTANARPTSTTSSHYLVRHSLCLYAASSVILALCYLTIPTVASDTPHTIFAEGKSDKEILDHLLKGSRYDKRLLPPVDGSLTVNVSVLLLSLASPDESSLKYEVEFLLQQQWYDPRLRYANQSSYEFLNAIHHHEDIWLPDTYFIMHGDFKDPIIPMHFALRIFRNGTINYLMRRHLILSCQGRLNIFPFDDPLCSFALESISYEQSAIRYVWKNDEDTLRKSPSLTTLNAYLIQNQTITCPIKASWRGNYSCLKVDLMFTRDRAFYFTTVFIPGIILVTSSFITFWLEWNAVPARVMIGVTTMLNFFTTSNGFRSTLPVVSNLTAMNVWDGVCMCFIYASLLEFVCVNYVGRKRPLHNVVYRPGENPVTQRLPAVLNRIGIILASPLETIENEFHMAIAAEKSTSAANTAATAAAAAANATSTTSASAAGADGRKSSPTSATSTASPASSRPASTILLEEGLADGGGGEPGAKQRANAIQRQPTVETKVNESGLMETSFGVKKRESGGPNEIVACTSCAGGTSPCTHSANNGCATETCFVQVRKKEPPHPIRVAKTIDVIARITFPSAYAVFLIFFFIHYKGFS